VDHARPCDGHGQSILSIIPNPHAEGLQLITGLTIVGWQGRGNNHNGGNGNNNGGNNVRGRGAGGPADEWADDEEEVVDPVRGRGGW
jgi:hypothetical protein